MRELLSLVGPTPKADGTPRWFEKDEGEERLAQDRALIRYDYPDLRYGVNHRLRRIFLYGTIKLRAECGISTLIKTRVIFPDAYPKHEPVGYEAGDMFPHIPDRHFYRDGACCLWLPVESKWSPREATALHALLDQVATFFERQLIYDASPDKRWAWGQRGHGIVGYLEFVQDALAGDASLVNSFSGLLSGRDKINPASDCPCGSGKKYKYCHAKRFAKVIERLAEYNPFVQPPLVDR